MNITPFIWANIMESLTVSELAGKLKLCLNTEFSEMFTVVGEISNLKISGQHTYLTLKDDHSTMRVNFWGVHLQNNDGEHVEITGRLDYYQRSNNINFVGKSMKNVGIGKLHKEYVELYKKYDATGYFNNKLPLPLSIKNVGVITSLDGAAFYDFMYVLKKEKFCGNIYVYNCIAQGNMCPNSVACGIEFFNNPLNSTDVKRINDSYIFSKDNTISVTKIEIPEAQETHETRETPNDIRQHNFVSMDVIVITRGGGSFEDLMGFSHPKVIESIHNSKCYTISAIGHEVDEMLSDHVANYRAPTPSIAGDVIARLGNFNNNRIETTKRNAKERYMILRGKIDKYKDALTNLSMTLRNPFDVVREKLDSTLCHVRSTVVSRIGMMEMLLNSNKNKLILNDQKYILDAGFVLLLDKNECIQYDINDIFNSSLYLLHSSGKYKVKILKQK